MFGALEAPLTAGGNAASTHDMFHLARRLCKDGKGLRKHTTYPRERGTSGINFSLRSNSLALGSRRNAEEADYIHRRLQLKPPPPPRAQAEAVNRSHTRCHDRLPPACTRPPAHGARGRDRQHSACPSVPPPLNVPEVRTDNSCKRSSTGTCRICTLGRAPPGWSWQPGCAPSARTPGPKPPRTPCQRPKQPMMTTKTKMMIFRCG